MEKTPNRKYSKLTNLQKKQIIEMFLNGAKKKQLARMFNVYPFSISYIIKHKEKFLSSMNDLSKSIVPPMFEKLENQLIKTIMYLRSIDVTVTGINFLN